MAVCTKLRIDGIAVHIRAWRTPLGNWFSEVLEPLGTGRRWWDEIGSRLEGHADVQTMEEFDEVFRWRLQHLRRVPMAPKRWRQRDIQWDGVWREC